MSERLLPLCLTCLLVGCNPDAVPADGGAGGGDGEVVDAGGEPDAAVPPGCRAWPTPARLPDGGFAVSDGGPNPWSPFFNDAGLESSATPLGACFETTWDAGAWAESGLWRPIGKDLGGGCNANNPGWCPPPSWPPENEWFADAGEPFVPGGSHPENPPLPAGPCSAGQGWSFESGLVAPWTGTLAALSNGFAVYGNNVSVLRLKPPGFDEAIEAAVGGDYWEYSRDINYSGRYWVGSSDVRPDWTVRPGGRVPDIVGGTLESPRFVIATPYLSFLIGGTRSVKQRVELVIDDNAAATLLDTYRGLGIEELAPGGPYTPTVEDGFKVVVRASTSAADNDYMSRRVWWDVSEYQGKMAFFRIVDGDTSGTGTPGHVNVDDFRCDDVAPDVTWLAPPDGGAPRIGQTLREPPLWGVTDSHTHVAANMTLRGYIWGDAADDLKNVYDCNHELPPITDKHGVRVRPWVPRPNTATSCFVSANVLALVTAEGMAACTASAAAASTIPFIGFVIASIGLPVCTGALATATAALSLSSVTSVTLHGATMPTSGGFRPGPFLGFLFDLLGTDLRRGMVVHGAIEQDDWDTMDGFHSGVGGSYLHQRYHATMIERAWKGGLRLMVIDALNSRAMQYILDARDSVDDWAAIQMTVDTVKRLVAPPGDPRWNVGPLYGIAEIALTPAQARSIVKRNKLAIILGTETQELGKLRSPDDSIERQVADLFAMGIRKITPIHGIDNPLGGTGFFNDIYNSAGVFTNLTRDGDNKPAGVWSRYFEVPVVLPAVLPPPLGHMLLATENALVSLEPTSSCIGPTCEWNLKNRGWFYPVTPARPAGIGSSDDFIGDYAGITFRAGLEHSDVGRTLSEHNPYADPEFLYASKITNLGWLLGAGPGGVAPVPQCTLDGMFMPMLGGMDERVRQSYATTPRQMNVSGLTSRGRAFLEGMMEHGMLIDTDHMGQHSRLDANATVADFSAQAGVPGGGLYPVLGIHTDVRGVQRHSPYPLDDADDSGPGYARTYGWSAETDKTEAEIRHIVDNGGVVSPGINGGVVRDIAADGGVYVRNNCDFSSKSYAAKYLQMVRITGGRGLTPSTDNNSPSPRLVSRFGMGTACRSGVTPESLRREVGEDGNPRVANWPADFHPDVAARCRFASASDTPDPTCPGVGGYMRNLNEYNGVLYDDYAGRHTFTPAPGLGIVVAHDEGEYRDDNAYWAQEVRQEVRVGGGGVYKQLRPLVKFRTNTYPGAGNRGWDFNIDGLANEGLLPDTWQDLRNVGVTWEQLGPMFESVEAYVAMWERACRVSRQWHAAHGSTPALECE